VSVESHAKPSGGKGEVKHDHPKKDALEAPPRFTRGMRTAPDRPF